MAFDVKQFLVGTLIFAIVIISAVTGLFYTGIQNNVDLTSANSTFTPIVNEAYAVMANANDTAKSMQGFVNNNQVSTLGALNDMINGAYSILKTTMGSVNLVIQTLTITVLTIPIPGYIIAAAISAFIITLIMFIVYLVFIRVRPQ